MRNCVSRVVLRSMKSLRFLPKFQVPTMPKQIEIISTSSAVCHLACATSAPPGVASGVAGQREEPTPSTLRLSRVEGCQQLDAGGFARAGCTESIFRGVGTNRRGLERICRG
eukprot:7619883-Pyramimonas_sp.AAC.1